MSGGFLDAIRTRLALRRVGAVYGVRVVLEGRDSISLGPGMSIGDRVKIRSRGAAAVDIGRDVRMRDSSEINAKGAVISLGDYCFVAKGVWIGGRGRITIASNVMIGIGTTIVSSDHDYINITVPYYDGSEIPKPISIGANVWIGANCVVLGDSSIGAGSVVAAGSVVHGEYPENSFIAGVPGVKKFSIDRGVHASPQQHHELDANR